MPIRNEPTFSEDEYYSALSLVFPEDVARAEAFMMSEFPDPKGFEDATPEELAASEFKGPRSYDGDILDLLSLVSASCAARAWSLLGISPEEGERRRAEFRRRLDDAIRERDSG